MRFTAFSALLGAALLSLAAVGNPGAGVFENNLLCVEAHADPDSVPPQDACGSANCTANPSCNTGTIWIQHSIGGDCKDNGPGCSLFGGTKAVVLKRWKCETITVGCPAGQSKCSWGIMTNVTSYIGNCKKVP